MVYVVVLLLGVVGVQAMKDMAAGVTVLVVKDPHDVAALHLLSVVGATADLLHTAMPVVLHLMLMEIDAGIKAGCCSGRT